MKFFRNPFFLRLISPGSLCLAIESDLRDGFVGVILSYGFGDDGRGNADAVLSGKLAWHYALKRAGLRTWQCEYVDFSKPDYFRLNPEAPPRPKGFYYAKFRFGEHFPQTTVNRFRKQVKCDTGCSLEGIQLLTVTHPHMAGLMNERKLLFMAFADYDVAPYGFDDYFDALQIFCSVDTLGLGIGNVDRNYPLFGIPTLRFSRCNAGENQSTMERKEVTMAKDLVCGMQVEEKTAAGKSEYHGKTYYFCSTGCKAAFDKQPDRFVSPHGETPGPHHH